MYYKGKSYAKISMHSTENLCMLGGSTWGVPRDKNLKLNAPGPRPVTPKRDGIQFRVSKQQRWGSGRDE